MIKIPERIGTVWTATAKIKFIDDGGENPVWVTVATCVDTPNAIAEALRKARKACPNETLWVHSDTKGRYIL